MCVGVQQAFLHNPLRERMRQNRLVEINKKKGKRSYRLQRRGEEAISVGMIDR